MKIVAIQGIFNMNGKETTFIYSQGEGLLKLSCTYEEAVALVQVLESGTANKSALKDTVSALHQEMASNAPEEPVENLTVVPEIDEEKPAKKKRASRKKKDVAEVQPTPQAEVPPTPTTVEAVESLDSNTEVSEIEAKVSEIETKVSTPSQPLNGVPPEEIVTARKLKNIVTYFLDQGERDPNAIFVKCDGWKAHVPILQRASNLKHRIERICEALSA